MNKVLLLSSLDLVMQNWLEEQCAGGEFGSHDLIFGETASYLMACAAFTVFEGIADALSFDVRVISEAELRSC